MNDSWVGYLWKYYPDKSHPYHLTGEEVEHIYESENIVRNKTKKNKINEKYVE